MEALMDASGTIVALSVFVGSGVAAFVVAHVQMATNFVSSVLSYLGKLLGGA